MACFPPKQLPNSHPRSLKSRASADVSTRRFLAGPPQFSPIPAEAMPVPPQWSRAWGSCSSSQSSLLSCKTTSSARAWGPGDEAALGGFVPQKFPAQARRNGRSSCPPSTPCRWPINKSSFNPRRGGARVRSWLLRETSGTFHSASWGGLRLGTPAVGGLSREHFGACRRKAEVAALESKHSSLSRCNLLRAQAWVSKRGYQSRTAHANEGFGAGLGSVVVSDIEDWGQDRMLPQHSP